MKSALGVMCVVFLLGAVGAQESPKQEPDPVEKARAAYREILATRNKAQKESEELRAIAKKYSEKSKERVDALEKLKVVARASKAPLDPFIAVFRDADWTKFDVTKDSDLLRDGLAGIARDPDNGEKAVAASRTFLQMFPDDERIGGAVRRRWLPMALLSLDRDDEAVTGLRAEAERSKDRMKGFALMLLGDVESLRGNFAAAKSTYADIGALGEKAQTEIAGAKAAVIGTSAPALDSKHWIGGAPVPWADLKGKAALLGFFATWGPPGRDATVNWNHIRDQYGAAGLVCIGVTRQFPHGYLPADESQVENGGTSRQGMQLEDYLEHLTQYHTNMKLHYPFVVVEEAIFKSYGVMPLPTAVVLDRESRITLVSEKVEDDDLVRCAIRRHLNKK